MPHPISIPIGMEAYGIVKFDVKNRLLNIKLLKKL
jgi:hypothetical protein